MSKYIKIIIFIISNAFLNTTYAEEWFPLEVDVWEPPYNDSKDRVTMTYMPLDKASNPWKICVSIPHLKDTYWEVVNFALIAEAKRLGVRLRINEAGGYANLDVQRKQVEACMATGADGLILSAVDGSGLNDLIDKYQAAGKPVIDLINGVNTKNISGRASVTYFDSGVITAKYIKKRSKGEKKTVLWLPGPKGPTWSTSADKGFKSELEYSTLTILDTLWGDTGKEVQRGLINEGLKKYPNIDYIVGTSVSSDAAVEVLKRITPKRDIEILAYYYGPTVHRNIYRGNVVAAAVDQQAIQSKLAVDMVVRSLEGKLKIKHAGPKILVVDEHSIDDFDASSSIPPKGFRPVFSLKDWVK